MGKIFGLLAVFAAILIAATTDVFAGSDTCEQGNTPPARMWDKCAHRLPIRQEVKRRLQQDSPARAERHAASTTAPTRHREPSQPVVRETRAQPDCYPSNLPHLRHRLKGYMTWKDPDTGRRMWIRGGDNQNGVVIRDRTCGYLK